jgi:hypothetical protein
MTFKKIYPLLIFIIFASFFIYYIGCVDEPTMNAPERPNSLVRFINGFPDAASATVTLYDRDGTTPVVNALSIQYKAGTSYYTVPAGDRLVTIQFGTKTYNTTLSIGSLQQYSIVLIVPGPPDYYPASAVLERTTYRDVSKDNFTDDVTGGIRIINAIPNYPNLPVKAALNRFIYTLDANNNAVDGTTYAIHGATVTTPTVMDFGSSGYGTFSTTATANIAIIKGDTTNATRIKTILSLPVKPKSRIITTYVVFGRVTKNAAKLDTLLDGALPFDDGTTYLYFSK